MITVTAHVTIEGLHHWPGAPDRRDYLRHPHRHLFGVAATVAVDHGNREVEFHDLADDVRRILTNLSAPPDPDRLVVDFEARSCETLAQQVAYALTEHGYTVTTVAVDEDGESTATYTQEP